MTATPTQVLTVKTCLILSLHNIMAYYEKTYCWPTRATMQRLIYQRTGRKYSLSWIDKCLHWLNKNNYMVSYFRPGRDDQGRIFNRPSNRQLTRKALATMAKMGMKPARFLWNIAKKLLPPDDPTPTDEQSPREDQEYFPLSGEDSRFTNPDFRQLHGMAPFPPRKKS